MEQNLLQDQLRRAWQDNQALQGRLELLFSVIVAIPHAARPVLASFPEPDMSSEPYACGQVNAAMEQDMLQDQLRRAWQDNQALQGRLELLFSV